MHILLKIMRYFIPLRDAALTTIPTGKVGVRNNKFHNLVMRPQAVPASLNE